MWGQPSAFPVTPSNFGGLAIDVDNFSDSGYGNGTYRVEVVNANGCMEEASYDIQFGCIDPGPADFNKNCSGWVGFNINAHNFHIQALCGC
jgi:hypothetical protein